jgi:hypothetical protein
MYGSSDLILEGFAFCPHRVFVFPAVLTADSNYTPKLRCPLGLCKGDTVYFGDEATNFILYLNKFADTGN